MKIYTITCHDVYNAGASLQAYALMTYLESLGHDVEIIDYKPDYLSGHYKFFSVANPKYNKNFILKFAYLTLKFPSRLKNYCGKRKRLFDSFKRDWLHCTPKRYISNDDLKQNLPVADIYIAGSDQIWNTVFPNGKDPAFYLDFAPAKSIKASYAASFATNRIEDNLSQMIRNWLSKLDYISVRESTGISILHELGIDICEQVLDPVFLIEKKYWSNLTKSLSQGTKKKPYILVYDFDNSERIADFVKIIAEKNNYDVISVLPNSYFKNVFNKTGPISFLSLIENANVVVSNSFHATAFSLIFEKEFWVFNRSEGINTRMKDLITLLNLEDRLEPKSYKEKINYEIVRGKLNKSIISSKNYISRVLTEGYTI